MSIAGSFRSLGAPWSQGAWECLELGMVRVSRAKPAGAAQLITRRARLVLRTYSTSFFIVTRFLPRAKRDQVEAIYAAVRYPDEIVDTFPLLPSQKRALLDAWQTHYETALASATIADALEQGVPCFLALFTRVVRERGIPYEHYHAFLEAMRQDAGPRAYSSLDDLITSYIYGSAVVVGYFLTYVYGAARTGDFDRALASARDLAIALQLTNFLRDVGEDQRRGRIYLPQDLLRAEGIGRLDVTAFAQHAAINRVLMHLAAVAEEHYERSAAGLGAFAADSRSAIKACIDVYRQLNRRIASSPRGVLHRERVPFAEKCRVLPVSKYWRLPLAYLAP